LVARGCKDSSSVGLGCWRTRNQGVHRYNEGIELLRSSWCINTTETSLAEQQWPVDNKADEKLTALELESLQPRATNGDLEFAALSS